MDALFADPQPDGPPAPLAARLRPARLEDVVGQEHLLGPGSPLRVAIESGRPHSMLLHGPPGTGKTTLARIVAASADLAFEELSAVEAGRAEVRAVMERARHRRQTSGQGTVFFLDEVHRFNKAQQDALLPAVEEGLVTFVGATTENPAYEVNAALLSRCRVYELRALTEADVLTLLRRAGADAEPEALAAIAARSDGDARFALGALEIALDTAQGRRIDLALAEESLQKRVIRYDKDGDVHFDTISAWIKATRGSDPDASLYYLAVMLEGGEDPRFLARRMVILASEDVGNADPQALTLAVSAAQAVEHVGMPEAAHALAQCAVYLSLAPKSNAAYAALGRARQHVRDHGVQPPPPYLRNGGSRRGYEYPHDDPRGVAGQELMPAGLEGTRFWEPSGTERELAERHERIRRARGRA